jgi:hypothetical protein
MLPQVWEITRITYFSQYLKNSSLFRRATLDHFKWATTIFCHRVIWVLPITSLTIPQLKIKRMKGVTSSQWHINLYKAKFCGIKKKNHYIKDKNQ